MMNIRTCAGSMRVCAVALLAACGDSGSGTEPPPPPPPPPAPALRFVSGATGSDTIDTELAQALVVEVTGDDGKPRPGVAVRFTALPPSDPERRFEPAILLATEFSDRFEPFVSDSTDANGRVRILIYLGRVAGDAKLFTSVPEFALGDTARFKVLPGHATRILLSSNDTSMTIGGQLRFVGEAVDRYENARSDAITFESTGVACDVSPSGLVNGLSMGACSVTARVGFVTEGARVSVLPDWELIGSEQTSPFRVVRFRLGSDVRTLVGISGDGEAIPATSGDGHIVFRRSGHLVLVLPTGAIVDPFPLAAPAPWQGWARFSFDNRWVYFAAEAGVFRVTTDGSVLEPVYIASTATTPDPSPDGTRVAFSVEQHPAILDLATGALLFKSIEFGTMPRWSPQGDRIAFIDGHRVWVMDADGTSKLAVSRPEVSIGDNTGLDWSRDGEWIIASSRAGVGGPGLLEIIKADGTNGLSARVSNVDQFSVVR